MSMKTTISIGEKSVDLLINGVTPILFKQIFHRDFMVDFSTITDKVVGIVTKSKNLNALKDDLKSGKITEEEFLEEYNKVDLTPEELAMITERAELCQQMAFVMNKQATEADNRKLFATSIYEYYDFLSQFEKNDLNSSDLTNRIMGIWRGETKSSISPKN